MQQHTPRPAPREGPGTSPLTIILLVVAISMLSYFVHLVNLSVQQGERLHQGWRAPPQRAVVMTTDHTSPPAALVAVAPATN